MRNTIAPAAMVVAGAPPRGGRGLTENIGGRSGPRKFLGLMDLTQLARLVPNLQVVAILTNRENQGGRPDAKTTEATGGGRMASPTNGDENGRGMDGVGGVTYRYPPPPQLG